MTGDSQIQLQESSTDRTMLAGVKGISSSQTPPQLLHTCAVAPAFLCKSAPDSAAREHGPRPSAQRTRQVRSGVGDSIVWA
jgi:hypothetical protein